MPDKEKNLIKYEYTFEKEQEEGNTIPIPYDFLLMKKTFMHIYYTCVHCKTYNPFKCLYTFSQQNMS